MPKFNGGFFQPFDDGNELYKDMKGGNMGGYDEEFPTFSDNHGGFVTGGETVTEQLQNAATKIKDNLGSWLWWLMKIVAVVVVLFILLHLLMFFLSGDYKFYSNSYIKQMGEKLQAGTHTRDEAYLLNREHYFATRAYNRDMQRAKYNFAIFAKTPVGTASPIQCLIFNSSFFKNI
jgi:hypothetical protein